jgi:adenine-specific DNA-methyltransferase
MRSDAVLELDGYSDLPLATQHLLSSVSSWWEARATNLGLDGHWVSVTSALVAQPPAPLEHMASGTGVEPGCSADELGQAYVSTLSAASRSKHGQHYTPPALANRLWEMARAALGYSRGKDTALTGLVRDPACGAGALLLPPLREHLRASAKVDPSIMLRSLPSRIHGVDQDPWSAWLTNVVLGAEVLRVLARAPQRLREPIPVLAEAGDGLEIGRDPALVSLQNPPYGRVSLDPVMRERFDHVLYGHANLYALFMAAGAADVEPDGVLAALVPTSFTAGRYFYKLREHFVESLPLHAMNFVDGRNGVFAGVLQETCLVTFKAGKRRRVPVTRSNGETSVVASVPPPNSGRPWMMPREAVDAAVAAAAAKMPETLGTAGWHASTGPLVWNRRAEDLFTRPSAKRAMIIWAADIEGGLVGRSAARDSMRYLALTVPSDEKVMVLDEPAILVQRTTAPEQSRRLIVADLNQQRLDELGGRVVAENHVNVLRATVEKPLISRETLARVLATPTLDRVVRCISGSVGLSSYELASLPLPSAKTLATWETLQGEDLARAVALAYAPGA